MSASIPPTSCRSRHLYPCFLLIPQRSHSSTTFSLPKLRNLTRSFTGDVSFQDVATRFCGRTETVTYVPDLIRHLGTRFGPRFSCEKPKLESTLKARRRNVAEVAVTNNAP